MRHCRADASQRVGDGGEIRHFEDESGTMEQPGELFDDVVAEILFRLPAHAVLRCRVVCRRYRRLADDPSFLAASARHLPLELLVCTTVQESGSALCIALDSVLGAVASPGT